MSYQRVAWVVYVWNFLSFPYFCLAPLWWLILSFCTISSFDAYFNLVLPVSENRDEDGDEDSYYGEEYYIEDSNTEEYYNDEYYSEENYNDTYYNEEYNYGDYICKQFKDFFSYFSTF